MENDRDILLIAIFTLLTVGVWISFELVKTTRTSTVETTTQQLLTPIQPKIDMETLDDLSSRRNYK
jgi:hypothetical protein